MDTYQINHMLQVVVEVQQKQELMLLQVLQQQVEVAQEQHLV